MLIFYLFRVSFHSLVGEQVKRYFYRCLNDPFYRNILLFFVEILVFCFNIFFFFFTKIPRFDSLRVEKISKRKQAKEIDRRKRIVVFPSVKAPRQCELRPIVLINCYYHQLYAFSHTKAFLRLKTVVKDVSLLRSKRYASFNVYFSYKLTSMCSFILETRDNE